MTQQVKNMNSERTELQSNPPADLLCSGDALSLQDDRQTDFLFPVTWLGEVKFQNAVKTQFGQNSDDKNIFLIDFKIVNYFKGGINGDGHVT